MKTYPILRADGSLHAFEIDNAFIAMGTIKRILRNEGATSLKRQFRSDDRLVFRYGGEEWVVHEPWGDNSRYWIGPQHAKDHRIDVAPMHNAFAAHHGPIARLSFSTPNWYPSFCHGVAALGWLPILFMPPVIHGGTVLTEAIAWGGITLGGYCSLELVRMSKGPWFKAPAFLGCLAYGALLSVGLYFAIPLLPELFR